MEDQGENSKVTATTKPEISGKGKALAKHKWKKGSPSPNPGGRPKLPVDVREALRACCPKAVDTLIKLLGSQKPEIRLKAAQTILERVYGKPDQPIVGADGGPIQLAALVVLPQAANDD